MEVKLNNKAVIAFDLDDTLYKEVNFVRSAFSAIAQKIDPENWEALYLQMFLKFEANEDVFHDLQTTWGVPKKELITLYRSHFPTLGITEIPIQMIRTIKAFGGKAGVITDGRELTQNSKLEALGISDLLDFKIISEATGHDKTTAHNFLLLESLFPEHHFTYIADNPAKDFYHPNHLGWNTIGILDAGDHIHKQDISKRAPAYLPHAWINAISELHFTS